MKIPFLLGLLVMALASPLQAAGPRGDEPIPIPRTVRQGIDFIYVDPDLASVARKNQRPTNWLLRTLGIQGERRHGPNLLFSALSDELEKYQANWGALPQVKIPGGSTLKPGSTGKRVSLLRTRLGLAPVGGYDRSLADRVSEYQLVHGLAPVDGIAGRATIASLNRGADYYERKIAVNVERAYRLPQTNHFRRYVLVDSGAAEVYLIERDKPRDWMRAIVGAPETKTPTMALLMRNALANPYWNVPPDLIRSLTAKRVLAQGVGYLDQFHYEVLSDWAPGARRVDPKTIDWKKVAAGKSDIRVRQLSGPWNSMGAMKFEMPNDYGIYLHDTPHKEKFALKDRWISNGCVRLEDYARFASWFFDRMPRDTAAPETIVEFPEPVPVFMTYFTVAPWGDGIQFRPDPYGYDEPAMKQMFGTGMKVASAEL
jgi:murein L,D-transpeptidase YcbB/YkuD